jgi:hypothetical protein
MTVNVPHLGKITASKSSLAHLATIFMLLEDYNPDLKELRNKQWRAIFDPLDETGFFDEYKE